MSRNVLSALPIDRRCPSRNSRVAALAMKVGLQWRPASSSCHSGVNIGGHGYYPFGLVEKPGAEILPAGDKGRFAVTETADDEYVFRAAPLRNIALTAPYFHSGKVWDLSVAVEIMAESQLGEALKPEETAQLVAFLDSLTGTLPAITLPVLPAETASTPRPTSEVN